MKEISDKTSEPLVAFIKALIWVVLEIGDHAPRSIGFAIRVEPSQEHQGQLLPGICYLCMTTLKPNIRFSSKKLAQ
jgi:hypothetical protein